MIVPMRVVRGWVFVLPVILMAAAVPERTPVRIRHAAYTTCGTTGDPACSGALTRLDPKWSGDDATKPPRLSDEIAKILDDVVEVFESGSYVAVPRKA